MSALRLETGDPRLVIGGVSVSVALLLYAISVLRNPVSKVPGPWYSRWTRAVLTYHWMRGERARYVHELHRRYGPIVRVAPGEVVFTDLEAVRTIYTPKETFVKDVFYPNFTTTRIHGVFNTADVAYNRKLRRLLGGPMSDASIHRLEGTVVGLVDMAVGRIGEEMRKRGSADVLKWWTFMATDVIGQLTFGESFRMLDQGKPSQYSEDLSKIAPVAAIRSTFPVLVPLTKVLPIPFLMNARQSAERIYKYAEQSLERYRRLLDADPTRVTHTLFTNLFKAKDNDTLTTEELTVTGMSYIIAGTDTTANTLTYLSWEVSRRPDVKAKLLAELRQHQQQLREGETATDAQLKELPYLNAVISETLRLWAAAPSALPRVVPAGGAELSGHWIPAGTVVSTQAYSMHRNPRVFPDPLRFDPDRWLSSTKEMRDHFMPFGRAARICLGMHLAQMELRHAARRFVLEFPDAVVSKDEGMSDEGMVPKIYFLITPTGHKCLIQENATKAVL